MVSDSRSLQSEMAVSSCPGSHGWQTCCHSMSKGSSLYYSYKGFHTIMLLGLVDADNKFIRADVESNGEASDAQIFAVEVSHRK